MASADVDSSQSEFLQAGGAADTQTTDMSAIQLTGSDRWEVLTPVSAAKEDQGVVHIPNSGIVTSNGQYVLPIGSLPSQPIYVTASGSEATANGLSGIQYQVIPQIQNADGTLTGFPTQGLDDGTGQIQLLQDGSQSNIGISCSTTAATDLLTQAGQVQSIQGVSLAGGSAYAGTVPVGLPGNITFVPINSVDLESLGLTGAQTVPIATGVTPEGQLIMSSQPLENQSQDGSSKQSMVTVSDPNTNQEIYVPTTSSSSNASQLPATIDGTGVLTQATAVSAGVADPSSTENFNSHNHLQQMQGSASNATTISQPILLSGDAQAQVAQVAQVAQGQDLTGAGQTLQSVQLVNPGTFLIQAQTVTATGQIQWQTFQVQGVQSLQGLQLPQGQGQTQQLTLAPVQTLPLGQTGQVSLPNLQTVTVNSVTQTGVQYTQGDDARSPAGKGTDTMTLPSSLRGFTIGIRNLSAVCLRSSCFRDSDKRRAGLGGVAAQRGLHAEPQRPEQPAGPHGRRGHGHGGRRRQTAPQGGLHLPQLQGVRRKGLRRGKEEAAHLPHRRLREGLRENVSPESSPALAQRREALRLQLDVLREEVHQERRASETQEDTHRREEVCVLRMLQEVHAQRPPGQAHKDSSEQKGRRAHLHLSTHHRHRHHHGRNHAHPPDRHRPRPCSQSGDPSAAGHRGAR